MNYTIDNPKAIDLTIQKIQTYLFDNLNWGEIDVYGRVYKNPSETKGLVLEAYIGNDEYKDVFTDDSKVANIFFIEDDDHSSVEGIKFTSKLKIVFMVNLRKAYPNINHRADMEAQIDAITLMRKRSGFSFKANGGLEKGIKKCLGEFYTDSIVTNDMHPYHVFSITGEITYQISCLT